VWKIASIFKHARICHLAIDLLSLDEQKTV